jgi:acyl-CoA reductase-like NAD-dependent aldehyde dehydrogenase
MSPFATELTAARAAQETWARVPVGERLRPVRRLRALLAERADDIVAAVHADIARPPAEVIGTELLPTCAALKFLERRAARVLAPARVSWWDQPTWLFGCRDAIHRRPWGVVGVIGTWNYPIYLNFGQIGQAFVAGNAVLWKPSENVPRTAELTHALVRAAGFPEGLLQVLPATREAGPRLAETDVDYVVFTGADATGRRLAARLGERLVPSTLELSGCDAMFVLADADVRLAARAAWFGVALNRGQTCIAVRRIFVQRDRMAAFAAELGSLVRADPLALVTEGQRVQAERLIADAVARGATVLAPAAPPVPPEKQAGTPAAAGGNTLGATFLLNAGADAAICREACFAPVAAVVPFDTVEEALTLARRCPFGLSSSVFTADAARAKELAARIPAGSVVVNDVLAPTAHPATPFGGRGASGWGVTQGADGLLALTVPQVVTVHAGAFRPHFDETACPDPATADVLRGLLAWTHARGPRAKARGLWRLVRGVRKKK